MALNAQGIEHGGRDRIGSEAGTEDRAGVGPAHLSGMVEEHGDVMLVGPPESAHPNESYRYSLAD